MPQTNPNRNSHSAKRKLRRARKDNEPPKPTKASFAQESGRAGLLVTDEFQKAVNDCKERVNSIARDCRLKNRKFRDIEFDLEFDAARCLYGVRVPTPGQETYGPTDVQRATQIFEKPAFYVDGVDSNDIHQGALSDCWFLSALATLTSAKGLIQKFCVAQDDEIGIYGFIFFKQSTWVQVIIDDLLFTRIPKFEELHPEGRALYHDDKENYNKSARKTGKSLLFARSGTHGETWVPLVEKAFAKLHGNYASLDGGWHGEGVEDLTGGVSTWISVKDIFDKDKFWRDELLLAGQGSRLFGCGFDGLDGNGLVGGHAYSILRAVDCMGKRFVVIRNPWGNSEWTGKWSDGSKEWTTEWLPALEKIGHTFGNDGQFVMEYEDFLESWDDIERVRLFDESWVMSSQWLDVTLRSSVEAWSYGDVSFTIEVSSSTPSIIVLTQLDKRYYQPFENNVTWALDFIVYKKGESLPVCYSTFSRLGQRSVNAEVELEAGVYVVHVRIDRTYNSLKGPANYPEGYYNINLIPATDKIHPTQPRYMSRVYTERAKTHAISMNANKEEEARFIPISLSDLAGQDLGELRLRDRAKAAMEALQRDMEALGMSNEHANPEPDAEHKFAEEFKIKEGADKQGEGDQSEGEDESAGNKGVETGEEEEAAKKDVGKDGNLVENEDGGKEVKKDTMDEEDKEAKEGIQEEPIGLIPGEYDGESVNDAPTLGPNVTAGTTTPIPIPGPTFGIDDSNYWGDFVTLGLRVYTSKDAPAKICGQLRDQMDLSFDGLVVQTSST